MCPAGDSIQEARCSRDGGGDEESGPAVCKRRQRYDKEQLSPGTRTHADEAGSHTYWEQAVKRVLCCADLSQVPAGLPAGEEAEGPPGLCGGSAAVRAQHGQRVGAGDAGVRLPGVPPGRLHLNPLHYTAHARTTSRSCVCFRNCCVSTVLYSLPHWPWSWSTMTRRAARKWPPWPSRPCWRIWT